MKPCATYSAGYNRSMKAIALLLLLTGCSTIHKLNAALDSAKVAADSLPPLTQTIEESLVRVTDKVSERVETSTANVKDWHSILVGCWQQAWPVLLAALSAWALAKHHTRRQNEKDTIRSRVHRVTGSRIR